MKLLLSLSDQSFLATKSVGIFNVSMGLARGLMQCPDVTELHILGNRECAAGFQNCPPHVQLHLLDRRVPRRFARIWWDQVELCKVIRRIAPDWAILPKGFPPFFPQLGRTRLACYVHDVNWEYYSTRHGKDSPFPRHELLYFRTLGLRALRIADLILTSTQFNKARFEHYEPSVNTRVVGIGFDDAVQLPTSASKQGILFHASPYPHKLTTLGLRRLDTWLKQREDADNIRIHVVGRLPHDASLPNERWIPHSRIPYAELVTLQRDVCRASVYFSDYEGFGMPPVESLRLGTPCVASAIPPICENIPARYLFRNEDEADFVRCMNRAWDHPLEVELPAYPDWRTVAQRCVAAMQEQSAAPL